MPQTTLTVNGRDYDISCGEGEEAHLAELAAGINQHIRNLADQVGQLGEARMLLMVALILADELHDLRADLKPAADGDAAGDLFDAATSRIEKIAARLEKA